MSTRDPSRTRLANGEDVQKDDLRLEVIGALDELNSHLGLARSLGVPRHIDTHIREVQKIIFELGALVAGPATANTDDPHASVLSKIESMLTRVQADLPALSAFVLPGGTPAASALHVARAVCRRAERRIVRLNATRAINDQPSTINGQPSQLPDDLLASVNRLSLLLFALARACNHCADVGDEPAKSSS